MSLPAIAQPVLLPVFDGEGEAYQLARLYTFTTARGWLIRVPKGFLSDGASVPRFLWWFVPPDGLHRAAALVHDYLYAIRGDYGFEKFTRLECDLIFYALLQAAGCPRARLMFLAVRAFGWIPWMRSNGIARVEPPRYVIQ